MTQPPEEPSHGKAKEKQEDLNGNQFVSDFEGLEEVRAATHHLAGWVLGQAAHHAVHLVELLLRELHLSVEILVLGILVVEHSSVLVPLLVGSNRWVFTGDEGGGETSG